MHEESELNYGLLPNAFILSHAWAFWGDANKGAKAEGPPTQHKAAQWNMARAIGKGSSEEEKEGEQHR